MRKLLIIFVVLTTLISCQDYLALDTNTKVATQVQSETLFANAQLNLMNWLGDCSVNTNIFRLITQQWTETTYIDESNYDLNTRNIPQNQWHILYRDVLKDLKEAKELIGKGLDINISLKEKTNQKALIEITEVFAWSILVQTFGDIPYFQGLDYDVLSPTYDDAVVISTDLVTRLNSALASLDDSGGAFGDGADLLYNNDITKWKKFGNSLKLRLGIVMADADATGAKTIIEQAVAAGVFDSNASNAAFAYLNAPPNTNQIWVNLVQSGRNDFVPADTFVDFLNSLDDPRREFYFTEATPGVYKGGIYGSNNNFASFSHVSPILTAPDFEGLMMDYAEVEFYLAEAVERGINVGGTAQEHYNKAITASMEYWGVNSADIASYLAKPEVDYTTATGTYKQKIGQQSWIAFYNRGFEAWTQWRRLDFPVLVAPPDALSAVPIRLTYPASEQNLNKTNYVNASAKIGSDKVDTKLFFDVH